jgi:hypothetical protein
MSRKKKLNPGDRYVGLSHYLLNSEAYKTLDARAVKILIDIWKRHNGTNNGTITFSVREAAEIGVPRMVASRMLALLVERGFLAVVRNSAFTVKTKQARTWRLTAEPYAGAQGSKDFMRWKPDSPSPRTVRPAQNLKHSPSPGTPRNNITRFSPSPGTVRPESVVLQSLPRDTYRLPGGAPAGDAPTDPAKVRTRQRDADPQKRSWLR